MSSNEIHTEEGTKSLLKTAISAKSYLHLSKLLTKATLAKEFFEEAKTEFAQLLKEHPPLELLEIDYLHAASHT